MGQTKVPNFEDDTILVLWHLPAWIKPDSWIVQQIVNGVMSILRLSRVVKDANIESVVAQSPTDPDRRMLLFYIPNGGPVGLVLTSNQATAKPKEKPDPFRIRE